MIDFPNLPMPQPLNMSMGGPPAKPQQNAMQGMGMKMLQAALSQQGKNPQAPQPAVGQQVGGPGGPMNIVPPQQQVGILQRLLGPMSGGGVGTGVAPPVMDSSNALY